ncbi:MAG: hypothetical protein AB8G16_01800 [Gammaproteobacteria bacterium]
MNKLRTGFFIGVATMACATGAHAQNLLVGESGDDRVLLISGQDGSVLDANFLDIATQAIAADVSSTPIETLEVGDELWVSDQVADRIWRFDRSGNFLGDIGGNGELNNIRGMEVVGDTVYVAQGTASDLFSKGIVRIDVPTLTPTSVILGRDSADVSYFDVKFYNGELLVSNIDTGNDGIERYDLDGNFLGFFAQSDGVTSFDFPQQINQRTSNTNLLVGAFSLPSGVYEFQSDGTNLGIVAGLDFGPRAAYELGNGEILWSNGTFLRTDSTIISEDGSFRFFSPTSVTVDVDSDNDGLTDSADNCVAVANADQRDTDSDGIGNLCDADLNQDCLVQVEDLGLFRQVFFSDDANADFDGDGTVNVVDLGILRVAFFANYVDDNPSGVSNLCAMD